MNRMNFYLEFENGSNPYIHYGLTPEEFAKQIQIWSEAFELRFCRVFEGNILMFRAIARP